MNLQISTVWGDILETFEEKIEMEEKKYPLSDRDKIYVETITAILNNLDGATRHHYELKNLKG